MLGGEGGALTHKHFQMVVKDKFSIMPVLNLKELMFASVGIGVPQ